MEYGLNAEKSEKILFFYEPNYVSQDMPFLTAPSKLNKLLYHSLCELVGGKENVILWPYRCSRLYSTHIRFGPLIERITFSSLRRHNIKKAFFYLSFPPYTLLQCIKKYDRHIEIIAFFHNYETSYLFEFRKRGLRLFPVSPFSIYRPFFSLYNQVASLWNEWGLIYNEKQCIAFADKLIVMTQRDASAIVDRFPDKRESLNAKIHIQPMALLDIVRANAPRFFDRSAYPSFADGKRLLLIASDWPPNIDGLTFFVNDALSLLPGITLDVIGSIVLKKKDIPAHPSLRYHGMVSDSDIERFYHEADAVITPVLWGGGMKVKVAEALMFGKTVFGSKEAFVGYEVDEDACIQCDTGEEFVQKITRWQQKGQTTAYNPASRALYEKYHSEKVFLHNFKKIVYS